MKFFKDMTMGHTVIMGYNTYRSLPGDLPGRKIIVVYPDKLDGVETVNGIAPIVEKYKNSKEEVFICGGASIYTQFLPYAERLYLTEIKATDDEADTFFPKFIKKDWKKTTINKCEEDGFEFVMYLYERKNI